MAISTNEQILKTFLTAHARLACATKEVSEKLGDKTPKITQKEFQELIDSSSELLKESVKLAVLLGVKLEAPAEKTAKKTATKKTAAKKLEEDDIDEAQSLLLKNQQPRRPTQKMAKKSRFASAQLARRLPKSNYSKDIVA